jgi:hypothetical protein
MAIALVEWFAYCRTEEMAGSSRPRLVRLGSLIVISLVVLGLSAAIWGTVYVVTSAAWR